MVLFRHSEDCPLKLDELYLLQGPGVLLDYLIYSPST